MVVLSIVLFLLLALRFFLFYQAKPRYREGEEVKLTTVLLSEPNRIGSVQRFYVDGILVVTPRFPDYHYGDSLTISGRLEEKLLRNERHVLTISFPKVERYSSVGGLALAKFIRQKIRSVFESSLPNTQSHLLLGIVLGIKDNFPREFMDSLRISGTLHVVAASGMNVTMVAGFVASLFGFFLKRHIALTLSIVAVFSYALLSGAEASIVRAAIMGSIGFLALILGRQNVALIALGLAGWIMLFVRPQTLFDVGFQLSFLATLGLIVFAPRNHLTTTLAAQIATLPILLAQFGSYSPLSVVANTLVLPTIAPLMVIGGIGAILSVLVPFIATMVLILALPLLFFFEKVVLLIASISPQIAVERLPLTLSIGYYLIVGSIVWLKRSSSGQ